MKKRKIKLKELQVTSFITSLSADEAKDIRGGVLTRPQNNNGQMTPNIGRKVMWTISEQRKDNFVQFGGSTGEESYKKK